MSKDKVESRTGFETRTELQPLQRAFSAFKDFCFEHGGTLKNHKQFHELATALYKELCALNAAPRPDYLAAYRADIDKHSGAKDFDSMWTTAESLLATLESLAARPSVPAQGQAMLIDAAAEAFAVMGVINAGTEKAVVTEARQKLGRALAASRSEAQPPQEGHQQQEVK